MNDTSPGRGRHAAAGSGFTRARLVAVAAVVIVLALVGFGGWSLSHRGDSPPGRAAGNASTGAPATTTGPGGQDPSGSKTSPPGATSDALLAACRSQVSAGDALAKDAVPIVEHWREHTTAQTDYDIGTITASQAESIWDSSKKHGAAEVATYVAAQQAYENASGACAKVESDSGAAAACSKRAAANAKVASTSALVEADWAAHIKQMSTKKTMWATMKGYDSYMKAWMKLVDRAPGRLAAYDSAVDAAKSAPKCG